MCGCYGMFIIGYIDIDWTGVRYRKSLLAFTQRQWKEAVGILTVCCLCSASLTGKCFSNCFTQTESFLSGLTFLTTRESRLTLSSSMSMQLVSPRLASGSVQCLVVGCCLKQGLWQTELKRLALSFVRRGYKSDQCEKETASKCGGVEITYLIFHSCVWRRFCSTSKRSSSDLELLRCHLPKFRSKKQNRNKNKLPGCPNV